MSSAYEIVNGLSTRPVTCSVYSSCERLREAAGDRVVAVLAERQQRREAGEVLGLDRREHVADASPAPSRRRPRPRRRARRRPRNTRRPIGAPARSGRISSRPSGVRLRACTGAACGRVTSSRGCARPCRRCGSRRCPGSAAARRASRRLPRRHRRRRRRSGPRCPRP